MSATNHYHDRIHRATERLAQLQARELLASQRQAVKAKETQRREEAKRRTRVAELVFLAGAEMLDDAELVGTLLRHVESRNDHDIRNQARSRGASRLAVADAEDSPISH
ncbi:conjugal transfer protein TraD [Xanthomonas campestris pv. campestris]|uniref:conjugal transfer protein TraD n=1 Tax=Xanthomonas campestris TaxID=339 RepID=UPI001EEE6E28|nr:conjugal transfer protein TraD [Xanthomonas campestris]MCF8839702.1 conjugal transfer protein TraD [Xanthomonas campestris pv. campestris]MDO0882936.1 conjugal transfer protein TraD [Xanthomonas campestris pv. campestris]MEA0635308.1 conjugal transfer protein TraD [Xanthomonas campestris pv. campestris]MEA0651694.1 conjugal transfer protein TraD [Xanthomonas campestris pv. campestris]MEA0655780.1 conjugal transfer protein TraD [Xanthomonas campestris pv. campestris]